MENIITIFVSGTEMKASSLKGLPFFSNSRIIAEKGVGAEVGNKKLNITGFTMFKVDIPVTGSIESTLWKVIADLKRIKRGLIENLVQDITFLIKLMNDDFIDFSITKGMFAIHSRISVIFKFALEIENPAKIEFKGPLKKIGTIEILPQDISVLQKYFLNQDKFSFTDWYNIISRTSKDFTVTPPKYGKSLHEKTKKNKPK